MKTMKTLITKASALIITALVMLLASCIQEDISGDTIIKVDADATVTMTIDLPGGNLPTTKAMSVAQEGEVKDVDILVFEPNGGKYLYKAVGYDLINDTDSKKTFKAKLRTGSFDLMILGNSSKAVGDVISMADITSKTRPELESLLIEKTTDKWAADGSRPFPMWGMVANLTIAADLSLTGEKAIKLNRMNARIDVTVVDAVEFELTSVHVYNWNSEGSIVPNQSTDAWDAGAPKAKLPNVPSSSVKDASKPLIYKDAEISAKGTEREMYIFEALNLQANNIEPLPLTDRTCLVIGGKYKEGEPTYYRVDFANKISDKWVYLNVLRNHHYTVGITEVKGNGHTTPEEAFKSEPINIEANVVEWNDGGMGEVVFDGQNYLSISTRNSHFDQFGNTETTTITIKSNLTDLTFSDFVNTTTVGSDGEWKESPSGTWSNGHFTVKITGSGGEYTLTFEAKPTAKDEAKRKSTLKVSAGRLSASISLSQDEHMEYRLITSPNPEHALMVGDKLHRFPIHVTSTHDYMIVFGNTDNLHKMVSKAYTAETGDDELNLINISKDITTVWIEVTDFYNSEGQAKPRISTAEFKHVDEESSAASAIYNIIQTRKQLEAKIHPGIYETTLGKAGGKLTISIVSNIPLWEAIIKLNGVTVKDPSQYLSKTTGSSVGNLTFTAPQSTEGSSKVFTITIKEKISTEKPLESKELKITQRSPNAVRAEKNILSIDENGVLNLDGKGEIVLFKYGSLIGITSDKEVKMFKDFIVWKPDGFEGNITSYANIPYTQGDDITVMDIEAGTGDPCELAVKRGASIGDFRTPTGTAFIFEPGMPEGPLMEKDGALGYWYDRNGTDAQFYPWAHDRTSRGDIPTNTVTNPTFYYRTSSSPDGMPAQAYYLKLGGTPSMTKGYSKQAAAPIRCIKK